MIFALSLDDKHDSLLTSLGPSVLLSSSSMSGKLAVELWERYSKQARYQTSEAAVQRLCMGVWPSSVEHVEKVLTIEPGDAIAWRRRNLLLMLLTGCMVFVVDGHVGTSQELISLLTVARMVGVKTMGIIPAGAAPTAVPLSVLAAADVVLSGEADGSHALAILRSLTEEG